MRAYMGLYATQPYTHALMVSLTQPAELMMSLQIVGVSLVDQPANGPARGCRNKQIWKRFTRSLLLINTNRQVTMTRINCGQHKGAQALSLVVEENTIFHVCETHTSAQIRSANINPLSVTGIWIRAQARTRTNKPLGVRILKMLKKYIPQKSLRQALILLKVNQCHKCRKNKSRHCNRRRYLRICNMQRHGVQSMTQ